MTNEQMKQMILNQVIRREDIFKKAKNLDKKEWVKTQWWWENKSDTKEFEEGQDLVLTFLNTTSFSNFNNLEMKYLKEILNAIYDLGHFIQSESGRQGILDILQQIAPKFNQEEQNEFWSYYNQLESQRTSYNGEK